MINVYSIKNILFWMTIYHGDRLSHITTHFLIVFHPEQEATYNTVLCHLHAGVPWLLAGSRLVNGWTLGDVLTIVCVVVVVG